MAIESLRILGLLLHKSWLVRKRHYLATLIGEILLPVGLVACIWASATTGSDIPPREIPDSYYRPQCTRELIAKVYRPIFYAPSNPFTDELMANVAECFENKINITGFATETEFVAYYYENNPYNDIAVIFDESIDRAPKDFHYKLRGKRTTWPLYNALETNMAYYYTMDNPWAQVQICLGRAFVKVKDAQKLGDIPDLCIQRVPHPAHTEHRTFNSSLRQVLYIILIVAFMFPLFIETSRATSEKFVGVNVLMSMNGISNTLNLLSWILSGFIFLSVLCAIPILMLLLKQIGYAQPFVRYGNPLLVYFILIFYLAHLLTFGIHVSAYFSKALLVTTALTIINVLTMILRVYAFNASTLFLAPYAGILFPSVLFLNAMEEISSYEDTAEGIQYHNLFSSANTASGVGSSIGMFFILSAIGTILHFLLAIYVYAINPGKYGAPKSPLFFLKCNSKESRDDKMESLKYDNTNSHYFESAQAGVYVPGIQIRNLKKEYNISLFNKQKVRALRGVSIDFYKGQITSLLGHNGAGKTTMMSILTGMISPTDGLVLINSKNLKDNAVEIMQDMGLCTQMDMYFSSLTVSEQLLFFAMMKRKDKSNSAVRENVKALLHKLKLFDKKDTLPSTLSGGQKRRLCLGMALAGDSSILILDEPTSGLDPESRRVIWNILLKMRGQKTILISTHDMEEADILGDRIAIMHTGQLKSYGTSLFLKRLIGQNNVEVTLSIEPQCDPERIRRELHQDGVIASEETGKIIVSIPNSANLPDTLDNLEEKKKELGVSGFSVSLISLEQVFLKMTKENDQPPEPRQALTSKGTKVTGNALFVQTVRALLSKKLTYARKDYTTIIIKIFTIFMALLTNSIVLKGIKDSTKFDAAKVPISLDLYPTPNVLYSSYDKAIGNQYSVISKHLGGNPTEVSDTNLESALMRSAKENLFRYDNYMIAAAEFNETAFNAFYSQVASYSLPISLNLLWNAIVKNLFGGDHSINFSSQELPHRYMIYSDMSIEFGYSTALTFVLQFCSTIAMFVVHPIRESSTGVKHLQKMTGGVSGFTYWGTMFLFDLLEYLFLVALVVVGFLSMDASLALQLYGPMEICIEILLLVLFGINTLPLAYIVSFLKKKTSTVVRLLSYIPIGMVTLELIMHIVNIVFRDDGIVKVFRPIQRGIFLLMPYVSFSHSQISFFIIAQTNARCHRLPNDFYDANCKESLYRTDVCCGLNCYDGKCEKSKPFFGYPDGPSKDFSDFITGDLNLTTSLIYLSLTPLLYFGILALMECQFIQKCMTRRLKNDSIESNADEQVQREKSMIFQRIQTLSGHQPITLQNGATSNGGIRPAEDNRAFLVYELRKSYKNVKAVKDVSFGVSRRECFGLLGVNGAGKSTTFRMMTGSELADHGIMYIGAKDFQHNEKYYLSQMGYCPQNDAILKCLNSYEHLRLFARLRGIPEDHVENEIEAWIERLNLRACALQPSGTYSGGNKRRLNIAISLIGNPNLVLMDEPTTGVDPGARRSLWNVIKACQMAGQAVVLTSHSMEECEALCNRLAIMVDGKLVCIGASEDLKQRFGAGYDIQIRMDPEKARNQVEGLKSDMSQALNCVLTDQNMGYLMYHVAPGGTTWRKMYDVMNATKTKYDCIDDFLVLSSTLEHLFLLFARTASGSSTLQSID